jgi:hypothetical protein
LFTVVGVLPDPRKPNVVSPPAGIDPFQLAFVTVTSEPLLVAVPLQSWVRVCDPGQVQSTRHLPIAAPAGAWTMIWPWKPPVHEPVTLYIAVQPPEPGLPVGDVGGVEGDVGGVDGDVGGVDGDVGGVDGDVGGVDGGVEVPLPPTPVTSPLPPSKTTSEQP